MNDMLHQYAEQIEESLEICYQPDNGLMCFSLKRSTMSPWKESDFTEKEFCSAVPGYETMNHADFMNYENTGMVQGAFLSALCFKYKVTGDEAVLKKARRTFRGICSVYEMSRQIAPGFYCKPWGGVLTDETSSDQYIYTLSGLDEYYPLAPENEKVLIREMILSMVRFWMDHHYDWKYYGRPLHWPECRFISFMAFALKYGGGKEFEEELKRLVALQDRTAFSPFRSTEQECIHERPDGTWQLNSCPESALSTFLSFEEAMKRGIKSERMFQICVDSLLHGKNCLAGDGTVYGPRIRSSKEAPFREVRKEESTFSRTANLSPIFNLYAPYRKGGMQSTMFARFLLAFEEIAPEYAHRDLVKEILLQTGTEHLTWYEDPYGIFPDEIRWMTDVYSGDAAAHFLWCYWKLASLT